MSEIRPTVGDTSWFTHDRFGLFIHWGLYALAARHEWVKSREKIADDVYDAKYFKHFEPDLYDPQVWADAAANAGMKYFVVTTKHHEGFCLWDSKLTDYKSTAAPLCRRDLLTPMCDAFRSRDMRVGFYHSIIDWHHPQYFVDNRNHPRRDEVPSDGEVDGMIAQAGGDTSASAAAKVDPNEGRDQSKYAEYLRGQVRELLTDFGDVDVLWFDFSFPNREARADFARGKGHEAWESEKLYQLVRELRPDIVLNDRLDLGDIVPDAWDIKTPEQAQPRKWVEVNGQRVVWEACQTFSGSWGYHRDESSWRSVGQLIRTLIDCVAKGGNLLLNVGPTARGEFDARALDRLNGIGEWMKRHSRSIYGCTEAPPEFQTPQDARLTYNPETKRLYVHLFAWPYKHLHLEGDFAKRVEYAQLLNDGSEVTMKMNQWHAKQIGADENTLSINLPQNEPPGVEVPVIELFLKG